MLKIAICDDEKFYAEILEKYVLLWAAEGGRNISLRKFDSGTALLSCIQENGMFDLIFMDVEMEKTDGIKTAAQIRKDDYITDFIFVSQYEDYYQKAYDVHPFHFLSKPVDLKKFREIMNSYIKMKKDDLETYTFIVNKARFTLHLKEILYFYSEGRQVHVVGRKDRHVFYGKLNHVQQELEKKDYRFLRIHYSFLVNMKYIKEYHYSSVVMYNGDELCISKENRKKMSYIHMLLLEDKQTEK